MLRFAREGVRGLRGPLLLLFGLSGASCRQAPGTVIIGYSVGSHAPDAGDVAERLLDSLRRPGSPRILISTGDSAVSPRPGGALMGEVDKAMRFAANPEVLAVVGPGGSREALQTAPIYRQAGLPNIAPTSTSRLLHSAGPWTFMMAPDDSAQGEFVGAFVAQRFHARNVLLFYIPDEYGLGLATGTASALARLGVPLLARVAVRTRQPCPPRSPVNPYDRAVVAALRDVTPDVVIIAGRTIEAACIGQAVLAYHPGVRFVAGDGVLVDQDFVQMAGPAADSMYVVSFWHPSLQDSLSRAFVERFTRMVGRLPRHDDAMFFDGLMLMAGAIESGGPTRSAIREYLGSLGRSRPPFHGITGLVSFTAKARHPLLMTRIRGGRTELLPEP